MAVTIDGSNTPTAGGVVYGDGTEYASTAAGTSGQVLTSAGSSAPTWTTPSAGAMILLATLTPTAAANVDALTTFTSSYDNYLVLLQGIGPATSGQTLNARFAVAGSVDSSALYRLGASPFTNLVNQTSLNLLAGSGTLDTGAGGFEGSMLIQNTNATNSSFKTVSSSYFYNTVLDPTTLTAANYCVGCYIGTSALSGIRFFFSGGSNFAAQGKIRIYGISNS